MQSRASRKRHETHQTFKLALQIYNSIFVRCFVSHFHGQMNSLTITGWNVIAGTDFPLLFAYRGSLEKPTDINRFPVGACDISLFPLCFVFDSSSSCDSSFTSHSWNYVFGQWTTNVLKESENKERGTRTVDIFTWIKINIIRYVPMNSTRHGKRMKKKRVFY